MKKYLITFLILLLCCGDAYAWRRGSAFNEGVLYMDQYPIAGDPVTGLNIDPDSDGTSEVIFNADGTLTLGDVTYPATDGTNGQSIITDGSGTLSFATVSGGTTINALNDIDDVDTTGLTTNDVIKWTGSAWTAQDDNVGSGSSKWTDLAPGLRPNDLGDFIEIPDADQSDTIVIYATDTGGVIDIEGTQLLTIKDPTTVEGDLTTDSDFRSKTIIVTPTVTQTVTADTDTIVSSGTHVEVTPTTDVVLTTTPSIVAGVDGQLLWIHNMSDTFDIDLQDSAILSGSGVILGGAEAAIHSKSTMILHYSSTRLAWVVMSNPNTASLGANADLLNVRNATGTSIAKGKVVYISGYNSGQNRPTIALADADDSSKMPAIGVTATAIADGSNGEIITFGNASSVIDTSGKTVNDPVYVSVTAGEVVFVRPTGATTAIQRIGTVARVNVNNGVVIITGAGRQNDEENITEAYIFVGNANEKPVAVAMSGAVTIIADGTTTVGNDSHTHNTTTTKSKVMAGMNLMTPDTSDTESFHFAQFDWTATALTGHTNIQDDGSDTVTVKISEYTSAGVFIATLGTITFDGDSPADSSLTSFTVNDNNQLVLEITNQSGAPKSAMITVEGVEI